MSASSVSVVIPVHNRSDLLKRALASVREQTHPPMEVVVVDDLSTEDIQAAVDGFDMGGIAVRVLRNERNEGAQKSRLNGVEAARGELVALLDSDDWWEPTKLAQQAAALGRNPGSLLACRLLLATSGKVVPPVVLGVGESVEEYVYARGGFLQMSTFLAPRALLRDGLAATQVGCHDDTYLAIWLRERGIPIMQLEAALSHFDDFPRGDRLSIVEAEADKTYVLYEKISQGWSARAKAGYLVRDTVRRHLNNGMRWRALRTLVRAYHPQLPMSLYLRTLVSIAFGGSPLRFFRRKAA